MVLCKFWQQGTCRNGNNCRFEHTSANPGNQSSNRFAPLQNQSNQNTQRGRQGNNARELPYSLDKDVINVDLSSERPQWILSAYGPGRQAPAQLFGGATREQSFEEMRLLHYIGVAAGNPQHAIDQANQMYQAAEQQIRNAVNNLDGAINYITSAQNEHPNRLDVVSQSTSGSSQSNPFPKSSTLSQGSNAFGAPSQPISNPFGQPSSSQSALGTSSHTNPFGAHSQAVQGALAASNQSLQGNAFGAPSQLGAFGQPSSLGQKPNPFGASTASTAPAFGSSSQLGQGSGPFGQPSALGQRPNPFGTPSVGSGTFGQTQTPNAFGGPSQAATSNSFGAAQQPNQAFGAPSQLGAKPNPFGAPQQSTATFGSAGQLGAKPNPFSQSASTPSGSSSLSTNNVFGSAPEPAITTNPFGQSSTTSHPNAFGASAQPQAVGFGTGAVKNSFGAPSAPTQPNPFEGSSHSNPFGGPLSQTATIANPFGQTNGLVASNGTLGGQPGAYTAPTNGSSDIRTYSTRDGSGQLLTFKGKRVQYKDDEPGYIGQDGKWCKIFFPDGPPQNVIKTTTEPNDNYDAATEAAYKHLMETGSFPEDHVPLLPPLKEWVRWDF